MYFSHGRKFPKNLQGCEFENTPVSTSDIFMTLQKQGQLHISYINSVLALRL